MDNMDNQFYELSDEELEKVVGGNDGLRRRRVSYLQTGYLAIRTRPVYDDSNILGTLYNGDWVYSTERYSGVYVWVYAETRYDPTYDKSAFSGYGWVNSTLLS